MKKFAILSGFVVAGLVIAQGSGALGGHTKALADAQSLSATFTYQKIGGSPSSYKIDLAKPGMAKIDRGNELIVADGTSITILDRKANSYYKVPQTAGELSKYFGDDEMALFAPFFNAKAFDKFAKVMSAGTKNRKGMTMNVVEAQIDAKGFKKATYFIDPATNLARQVEYAFSDGPEPVRMLVDTKEFSVSSEVKADLFAFKAPEGSKEVALEDMVADKWYTDIEEAKSVASKTGRKMFVDFMASWCGPCKMLAAEVFPTPEFKKLSKYFVFVKIDVDEQPAVSKHYGITAMPTQMVVNADGSVVGKKVGYGGPADFFNFINGYTN